MMNVAHGEPTFARHETFAPRAGWLRKGFVAAQKDRSVFLREDAHLELGVGKNMLRAIRYWAHAFKLLDDVALPGQRSTASVPMKFGQRLLGDGGWDPYLEDPASLWLLHWRLIQPPCQATSWFYAFTVFARTEFTVPALGHDLAGYVAREYPDNRTAPSSLGKDAGCVVRMYGDPATSGIITEETIQSPFAELGLIRAVANRWGRDREYEFETGLKHGLPPSIVVAACLEYAAKTTASSTVALSRLLHDPGSPGMAFKLSEGALVSAIEHVVNSEQDVALADAAGLVQLSTTAPPLTIADRLLNAYYRGRRKAVAA